MASREFIEKRIAGKIAEIEKLNNKIARIEKAKASNWENNPYYYSERDLVVANKEKQAAENALADYQAKLKEEDDKAASRNIPVITEFLDKWEQNAIAFYLSEYEKYKEAQKEYYAEDHELCEKFNSSFDHEVRREAQLEMRKLHKEFRERWTHVTQFNHGSLSWEETMCKDIAQEKIVKYDDLINRVVRVTGPIIDASGLRIGAKGDINGIVIGQDGKADVKTIGAGGYNSNITLDSGRHGQIFHYRTLIRVVR